MARYTSSSRRRRRMPAAGRRKTEYREKIFSPEEKNEIDLTDEILAEAMLPEIMGELAGGHVKEDVYITKLLEDSMPKIHKAHKGSHIQAVETGTVTKFQELKQRKKPVKYPGTLRPFKPEEEQEEPRFSEPPPLLLILEIICGFTAVTALISTAIAWGVYMTRNGGL